MERENWGFVGGIWISVLLTFAGDLGLRAQLSDARANIKAVAGNAFCSTNGTYFHSLRAGDFVGPGSILTTERGSSVDLILIDSGTVLRMLPDTVLQFARLKKTPAGDWVVSDTSLKLLKGAVVGSQRKLVAPSHFDIAMVQATATIVGTEYIVNASGAVTVFSGTVSVNYNLPGNKGSVKVDVPAGYSLEPATGQVVPTSPAYLQNVITDVNTVQQNAQVFKTGDATIVVKPENFVSPVHGNNGIGNGQDPQPPGNPPINDGPGTSPGNPGNKGGSKS